VLSEQRRSTLSHFAGLNPEVEVEVRRRGGIHPFCFIRHLLIRNMSVATPPISWITGFATDGTTDTGTWGGGWFQKLPEAGWFCGFLHLGAGISTVHSTRMGRAYSQLKNKLFDRFPTG